jgi:surfactin synthase thioesterase subunit
VTLDSPWRSLALTSHSPSTHPALTQHSLGGALAFVYCDITENDHVLPSVMPLPVRVPYAADFGFA